MIICTNCHQANRPAAYYCKFCGQVLVCPRCRLILPEVPAGFCDNCGQSLSVEASSTILPLAPRGPQPQERPSGEPAPGSPDFGRFVPQELLTKLEAARAGSSMVGERRVVTMLFCDVKNSSTAAEQLDPEEWTEIINGAFEQMIKPVYKYEGTVARLMGDAILAFFGAPIAHEDDPQRAVLAGLDILAGITAFREMVQNKWGVELNIRVGINTGEVVVGVVGSDLRMEYTAMGDAVNLASRMEQAAEPGTVLISEETYKLVASLFEFEELGRIEIRGRAEPVRVYRVLRQQAETGRLRRFGRTLLPLVGREEALRKLFAVKELVQHGNGQIVFITGELGMGKTRLIEELHREWSGALPAPQGEDGEDLYQFSRWYETFSLSYETTRPYSLFRHFLLQVLGITAGHSPAVLAGKLAGFVSTVAAPAEREQVKTVLESLFGLVEYGDKVLEGETFKRLLYETMNVLVCRWANAAPGVMVADDIQWADPASIDLLMHLFKLTDRLPVLFVCAMRPNRSSPGWQLNLEAAREYPHRYTEIRLEPLSQGESRTLVSQLLKNYQLPDSLQSNIFSKAAGNPFFIEEVVQAMIGNNLVIPSQSGERWEINQLIETQQIAIPDSLQSILMARIDRLQEGQRRTLQLAALIGLSFHHRVLEQLAGALGDDGDPINSALDQQLGDLQRMELILQTARLPELEYIFRHALLQESAYKTILHKQRRTYHLKVGEIMEGLFQEQLDDHAIILAHHFAEGGDYTRALLYHTKAADMAFRLYANAEAVEHYASALEAAARLASGTATAGAGLPSVEDLTHLYSRRGRALELSARVAEAVENYEAMRQMGEKLATKEMELAALMSIATLYATPTPVYSFDLATSLSEQAVGLAQELNDRPAEAKILWNLSNMNRISGSTDVALEAGERALDIARELDLREQIAYSLNDLCHLYNRKGLYEKSKAALVEAIGIWRELENLPMLTDGLSTASYVYTFTGDLADAIAFSEEALRISQSIGNNWGISYSQWVVGRVYFEQGDPARAIETMNSSIYYAEKAGFMIAQAYTRVDLALVYGWLGDMDQGLQVAKDAQSFAENGQLPFEPYVLAQIAGLYLMNDDAQAAAKAIAAARASDRPIHLNRPDIVTLAECELPLQCGEYLEAIQLLEKRAAALQLCGMNFFLPQTFYLLGQALSAANLPDQALGALREGLQAARSIGSRRAAWQLLLALANLEDGEQARQRLNEAQEIVTYIAGNISDTDLRHAFLHKPGVQKLLAFSLA